MKRSFFSLKTEIKNKKNEQVVAQINRQCFNARQLLVNHSMYAVMIALRMNMTLIVMMVVYLNETQQH